MPPSSRSSSKCLRSSQRQFIQDRPLATLLPALMSSKPYPANMRIRSADQWSAMQKAGLLPADAPYVRSTLVDPAAPNCNPPASVARLDSMLKSSALRRL